MEGGGGHGVYNATRGQNSRDITEKRYVRVIIYKFHDILQNYQINL